MKQTPRMSTDRHGSDELKKIRVHLWNRWRLYVEVLAVALLLSCFTTAASAANVFRAQVTINRGSKPADDNSNVVVWLTPQDQPPLTAPAEPRHFRLVQKNKKFEPHLLVIPIGSVVEFPNEDPFFHNVFSLYKGKKFDLGLYESGSSRSVRFDRPGVSFVFCNIHPQMNASILVMTTPYYGISGKSGEVELKDVPNGKYRLQVWFEGASAEELQAAAREVTVGPDTAVASVRLHQLFEGTMPHKNKFGQDYPADHSYQPHQR